MADILQATGKGLTLKYPSPNADPGTFLQPLGEAVDVSAYDQVDVQFCLYTVDTGTVTFHLLTSMQNTGDGDDWESLGSVAFSSGAPAFKSVTFPSPILASTSTAPTPLLRYVRWKIVFSSGATLATVQIEGMLRRKAA